MTGVPAAWRILGSGRRADVYDLGGGKVLRRYREPAATAEREAEVMAYARSHGVPVPEVFDASGSDVVMARAAGPTMYQALTRRPWTMDGQARLLVSLHETVHAVPAPGWLRAPFGAGSGLLHTDLHPKNIILTRDGPLIIDWEAAARGPAAVDLALTWVIVATSRISGRPLQWVVGRTGQALFARRFLALARPLETHWLTTAVEYRLRDSTVLPGEAATLRRLLSSGRLDGQGPDQSQDLTAGQGPGR